MKLFNMYLIFYLQKAKINKKGFCPIYARITINKLRHQFSTGLTIKPKDWSNYRSIKNKHLNKEIESIEIEIKQIASSLRINNNLTIDSFREYLKPKEVKNLSLLFFLDNYRSEKIKSGSNYSDRFYKNILVFIELHNIDDISHLDNDFIDKFYSWLRLTKRSDNGKYLKKHFSYINQSLELAFNNELIKFNPFRKLNKPKFPPIKKQIVLTKLEINIIEEFKPKNLRHKRTRKLFLFSVYTGLSYTDVQNFNIEQIRCFNGIDVIIGVRSKTGVGYTTPFTKHAKQLLINCSYNLPKLSNQRLNLYLKEIAVLTGITKRITTHVARRTFGQLMLDRGANIESVSCMLGHSDIQTTQRHYASAGTSLVVNQLKLLSTG